MLPLRPGRRRKQGCAGFGGRRRNAGGAIGNAESDCRKRRSDEGRSCERNLQALTEAVDVGDVGGNIVDVFRRGRADNFGAERIVAQQQPLPFRLVIADHPHSFPQRFQGPVAFQNALIFPCQGALAFILPPQLPPVGLRKRNMPQQRQQQSLVVQVDIASQRRRQPHVGNVGSLGAGHAIDAIQAADI